MRCGKWKGDIPRVLAAGLRIITKKSDQRLRDSEGVLSPRILLRVGGWVRWVMRRVRPALPWGPTGNDWYAGTVSPPTELPIGPYLLPDKINLYVFEE
jgi:hypothetical protein